MKKTLLRNLVLVGLSLAAASARAQMGDPSKVTLKTTPVAGGISMIEGANGFAGGNVAASVGDDGLFIIDDEIEPMTAKLKTALGGAVEEAGAVRGQHALAHGPHRRQPGDGRGRRGDRRAGQRPQAAQRRPSCT